VTKLPGDRPLPPEVERELRFIDVAAGIYKKVHEAEAELADARAEVGVLRPQCDLMMEALVEIATSSTDLASKEIARRALAEKEARQS
jgi:hypothetical protein